MGIPQSTRIIMQQSINSNRALLDGFFSALREMFSSVSSHTHTKVHVTLKESRPYTEWGLLHCANRHNFVCVRRFPFPKGFFESRGYVHETTRASINQNGLRVDISGAHTYEFVSR